MSQVVLMALLNEIDGTIAASVHLVRQLTEQQSRYIELTGERSAKIDRALARVQELASAELAPQR